MRVKTARLLPLLGLAAFAPAQQAFELWPGRTSFTTRANLGTGSGETLQGFHATHHRGLGDDGSRCSLQNVFGTLQDQNAASRETFHWVVRKGSDQTGPGADTGSLLASIGPMQTPKSTSNSPVAFLLTTSITTPVALPDCRSHFSFGVRLPASPRWTNDGLSTHTSFGSTTYPHQGTHARAEDHAWQIVGTATVATHPPHMSSWRYGLLLGNGALQLGNGGAMYGMGGMFPAVNAPVTARARYGDQMFGGASVLCVSTGRIDGVRVFGTASRLFLGGTFFLVGSASIGASGEAVHTLNPSLPPACAGSPRHYVQAVAAKGGVIVVTNLQAINP